MITEIKHIIDNNKFDVYLSNQLSFFVDDDEKPIDMYEMIKLHREEKLKKEIIEIVPKIDIVKINEMIDEIPEEIASAIRKQYYKTLIRLRYEKCLLITLNSIH